MRITWVDYFMQIANLISFRSTCIRRKIGAVAVRDDFIISTGYNGAPKGEPHCLDIGCIREQLKIKSGERHELCRAVHAEQNLICQAAYNGVKMKDTTVYCTHKPCGICAKLLINSGVIKVVYQHDYPDEYADSLLKNKLSQYKGE